jgi:hypothetical protein
MPAASDIHTLTHTDPSPVTERHPLISALGNFRLRLHGAQCPPFTFISPLALAPENISSIPDSEYSSQKGKTFSPTAPEVLYWFHTKDPTLRCSGDMSPFDLQSSLR